MRDRAEWLEEKLREQVEQNLELRAELEEWKTGGEEEWESPTDLHDKMQQQDTLKRLAPLVDSIATSKVWRRVAPRNCAPKGKP